LLFYRLADFGWSEVMRLYDLNAGSTSAAAADSKSSSGSGNNSEVVHRARHNVRIHNAERHSLLAVIESQRVGAAAQTGCYQVDLCCEYWLVRTSFVSRCLLRALRLAHQSALRPSLPAGQQDGPRSRLRHLARRIGRGNSQFIATLSEC
jgi:hypothetical protein